MTDERVRAEALEAPSQLPRPTPAPEKNHRDDPAEVENPHHSEARRESPDTPKKGANWQFIGVVVATISVVVAIIFGSLALRSSRENTEALRKIAEITAAQVAENPTEAAETAKSVQGNLVASLIDRAIASAVQLQRQGKTEEAIEKWRSIANVAGEEDRPLQARAWFSTGYLLNKGEGTDWEAVLDAYTQAIELDPTLAGAYNNRGSAKGALGQYDAAIADLDRAIELNPAFATAYNNRGNAKNNLRQYDAAIADLDRAIGLNPTLAGAYYNRGIAKNNLGQDEAAIADYDRAIELNPALAAAYYSRGFAKNNLDQYEAAIADYDRAIELNPALAAAYYNRDSVNVALDRRNAAREDFETALALAQAAGDENVVARAKRNLRLLDNSEASGLQGQ